MRCPLPRPRAIPALAGTSLALAALALAGCATLDRGVLDEVAVITDPPGARVASSTGTVCTSPCAVSGPREESFVVTAVKPGFATATATSFTKPEAEAIAAASRLDVTPGLLGRIIDVRDGSHSTHDPKVLRIKLDPAP